MKNFITVLLFSVLLQAEGFINWQPPVVKAKPTGKKEHGGHGGRKAKQFQVNNFDSSAATEAYYLMPTLEKRKLSIEGGLISLPRTGMENYHALVINQTTENSVKSSVRYIYSRGRPSKVSPTKITQIQKSALEIAPILLPKEHNNYKGSNTYEFELRFMDKILPQHTVTFATSNGTKETFKSDEDGKFYVTLPNDFKDVKMKRRANRPAEFNLAAAYVNEGISYNSTLAMPYYVNPLDYWHTQPLAIVLVFLGLVIGIFMFRNIHKKKNRKA
jgi:hypothetical protein